MKNFASKINNLFLFTNYWLWNFKMKQTVKKISAAAPLLSILILSLPERIPKYLTPLLNVLQPQCESSHVELIVLTDNKWRSIGAKRNNCMDLAKGKFIVFIDDDDMVSNDYVDSILFVINTYQDVLCVVFDVWVRGYDVIGLQPTSMGSLCRYGIEFTNSTLEDGSFTRKPNCRMVYRRDLAIQCRFLDINDGEDDQWGSEMVNKISVHQQQRIHKILYFYTWNIGDSEAGWAEPLRESMREAGTLLPNNTN